MKLHGHKAGSRTRGVTLWEQNYFLLRNSRSISVEEIRNFLKSLAIESDREVEVECN